MFSHKQLWAAIDALAQKNNMSVSRLARNAGLDPTTFNKSKRTSLDGRPRWPSTESLHKIIAANNITVKEFMVLMENKPPDILNQWYKAQKGFASSSVDYLAHVPLSLPLIDLKVAEKANCFDMRGLPLHDDKNSGWDSIDLNLDYEKSFVLEVSHTHYEPVYRKGDRLIINPFVEIRHGDRIAVQKDTYEIILCQMQRQTLNYIEVLPLDIGAVQAGFLEQKHNRIGKDTIKWMARIVGITQ